MTGTSMTHRDSIVRRVESLAGHPNLAAALSQKLQATDLQSLLLCVFEERAARLTSGEIWRLGRKHDFVQCCDLDQRKVIAFDHLLYSAVDPRFEAVELSPVSPFGLNAAIASTNQKKVVSTVRNTEVLSDLGTALALEASKRRADGQAADLDNHAIRLCSSHRALRAQKYDASLGFTPHFRIFGMLTSERNNNANHQFCVNALYEHIAQYLNIFRLANASGYRIGQLKITVSDLAITHAMIGWHGFDMKVVRASTANGSGRLFLAQAPFAMSAPHPEQVPAEMIERYAIAREMKRLATIRDCVLERLRGEFPAFDYAFCLDRIGGIGHYNGLCFKIDGVNKDGISFPLVDGGMCDWTGRLLSNAKELSFVSGIGSELFCRHYQS
jgi:hypothetical protein